MFDPRSSRVRQSGSKGLKGVSGSRACAAASKQEFWQQWKGTRDMGRAVCERERRRGDAFHRRHERQTTWTANPDSAHCLPRAGSPSQILWRPRASGTMQGWAWRIGKRWSGGTFPMVGPCWMFIVPPFVSLTFWPPAFAYWAIVRQFAPIRTALM